ncbi:MAG: hypothetical protein HYV20_07430 [Gemmatimonadetes bacterium]|nr:hypothetical protein [Gemmatimonadota bacterium]
MSRRVARWLPSVAVATTLLAGASRAQHPPPLDGNPPLGSLWHFLSDSSRARWVRPTASLVLPGTGQLLGGSERGALYLVAEALLLTRFFSLQHDGTRDAGQYRNLAFSVARGAFSPEVRDTAFEYFEAMAKYIESGPFDMDPGPDLVPPWDERTFNGRIWLLARQTFFADPDSIPAPNSWEYLQALDFYRRRAVGPNFRWSWRGAALEQDLYRQTIRSSDQAFRRARDQLGLLLANHLLSAIDALISTRLRGGAGPAGPSAGVRLGRARLHADPYLLVTLQATF